MTDADREFLGLAEDVAKHPNGSGHEVRDDRLNRIYELLPQVDRKVLRDAASYCSLGFGVYRSVPNGHYVAQLTYALAGVDINDRRKVLEYQCDKLYEQVKCFNSLELFPEKARGEAVFYFEDEFHYRLFRKIYGDGQECVKIAVPISEILLRLGGNVIELGDFETAEGILCNAVSWNCMSSAAAFEYCEALKVTDIEYFKKITLMAWRISFVKEDIARVFRNLAYYFSEKREWQNAYINLVISSFYDNDEKKIKAELDYIMENCGEELKGVTKESLVEYCRENDMPVNENPDVVDALREYSRELYDGYANKECVKYLQCLYNLTGDADVKKKIQEIKSGKHKVNKNGKN